MANVEQLIEKDRKTAGADERTPSHPQYFSWINSTNEGSTEAQTLVNLDYFGFLRRKYGMILEIYAWDAGNLDGASGTYEYIETSEKLKKQYPNGYAPLAEAAEKIGCHLGVWCGPDGFGKDEETAKKRYEQMVKLCRDYHFMEFKIDGVCGLLSEENREWFVKMMTECRKYSPDLVLLNHRLWLGEEGMKHATTFLWGGQETYVDVFIGNQITAPHHRAYFLDRGNTPALLRLTEDHGVCISSCIDYFEDDLIFQAFGRSLILAPEIYGNPWLMRDDEQAHLARIYNLHYRYRDILVNGMLLPGGDYYPKSSVARGSVSKRFIVCGNQEWKPGRLHMRLDMEIGLAPCEKVTVMVHHPYEKYIGEFNYGEPCSIELEPFRACLVEVCDSREADVVLTGCEYEVLHEDENGRVDELKIVSSTGDIKFSDGTAFDMDVPSFDNTLRAPIDLGSLEGDVFGKFEDTDENHLELSHQLEVAMFAQDQDSFEAQSLKRSGETKIPEVQAARDAFFNQATYKLRGPENRFAFDGKEDTFFDGISKTFFGGLRWMGGCLRVDFGEEFVADYVAIEYFDIDVPMAYEIKKQLIPPMGDYSVDMKNWKESTLEEVKTIRNETVDVLIHAVHNIVKKDGRRRVVYYPVGEAIRYFRLPNPLSRIYKIALIKDGKELSLTKPFANNLMPYGREVIYTKELKVKVKSEDWREGCFIAVGLEGLHGLDAAFAVLDIDGQIMGAPERAPSYRANVWECIACVSSSRDHHYTYYFPVSKDMLDRDITVRVLGLDDERKDYGLSVHLCDKNAELGGIVCKL